MGQTAYQSSTGELVEAFSATDEQWQSFVAAPKGSLRMPRTEWPACAKTSIRGLRFFAHYSGYPGQLPKPESYAHTRLKIDVARTLRLLGYQAGVEVPGSTPDGNQWIADVLACTASGERVAFEIQLSTQHLKEFRARTAKYTSSGVRVCWIMSLAPVASRLAKSLAYENMGYYREHGTFLADCEEIVAFAVPLLGKEEYPTPLPDLCFGRGPYHRRLPLAEALQGMMQRRPEWEIPNWKWGNPKP